MPRACLFLLILAALPGRLTQAQELPRPAVEMAAGWIGFADDAIVSESMIGAAFRWYLVPRTSVGPEVIYIAGKNHSHLVLTANLTHDLLTPRNGRARRVTPFVVAGGGLYQTRQDFPTGNFTSSEGAFTAGGGIRVRAGDRVAVGVDTRVGWELHIRVNGLVAVDLGR